MFHIVVTIKAKHSFHSTDCAAHSGSNNGAHRTRNTISFIKTVSCAARNTTLSLSSGWQRQHCEPSSTDRKLHFHIAVLCFVLMKNLGEGIWLLRDAS